MEIFTYCIASIIIISSFIPLIKNDYWTFRVFEYPRVQKLCLAIIGLWLIYVYIEHPTLRWVYMGSMLATIGYLAYQIAPFTPLWKKQILQARSRNSENCIRLMVSNVYEFNSNYTGCLAEIQKKNPDLVFLLETNDVWAAAVSSLSQDYPHAILAPLNNTYGMLLYSKFPLEDGSVKFLVEDDIPSIHTKVVLPSGQRVQLYGLHPTPPVPQENPRSTERDKELLLVADLAVQEKLPVLVFGDMNDVAWSYTTELFLKMSQLLDPRRGRVMLNTFHAQYPLLRFPLDHIFCSTDFKLHSIERLHHYNSDHFPVFIELQYEAKAKVQQEDHTLDATADDRSEAAEKKAKV